MNILLLTHDSTSHLQYNTDMGKTEGTRIKEY